MIDYSNCKHEGKECSWSNHGGCGPIKYLYSYERNFNKPLEVHCEKHYQKCLNHPNYIDPSKFKPLLAITAAPSWFDNLPEVER